MGSSTFLDIADTIAGTFFKGFIVSKFNQDVKMHQMHPKEMLSQVREKIRSSTFLLEARSYLKSAGFKVVYAALLLYHAYHAPATPSWAKRIILGSIAYLLAPIDLMPDLTPFLGFTDDFGVLMFGLVSIAGHITDDTRDKAKIQMQSWFAKVDTDVFQEIDSKI